MKNKSPFDLYAGFYDLLYKNKDYKGEAEYIDQLIKKFLTKKKKDIDLLDLACGTGRHLEELYKKGYVNLSGSDVSKSMIHVAKKNAESKKQHLKFFNHSFQESDKISQKFDVILSMFSAINYVTTYADQSKTLINIYNLLNNGGLFIFDYWNGNAVTQLYSPVKVVRKKDGIDEIMRISETNLDLIKQEAVVKFTCNYMKNDKKVIEFEEIHRLHYFYFSEIKNLLLSHSFDIIYFSPFMKLNKTLSPNDWNISVIAQKNS